MNHSEVIRLLAEKSGRTHPDVTAVLDALANAVTECGPEGIKIPALGKFAIRSRAARQGRNPRTGEAIQIAEKRVVRFTPSKALQDAVGDGAD